MILDAFCMPIWFHQAKYAKPTVQYILESLVCQGLMQLSPPEDTQRVPAIVAEDGAQGLPPLAAAALLCSVPPTGNS